MKRYTLRIERLEDRCVPAAVTTAPILDVSTAAVVNTTSTAADDSVNYVIDPYLIDPNATAPLPTKSPADGSWTPDQPVQPISDPLIP